jgi:transcription initiation factor TFIIIB Brf1 subunit/transcription initiation factor TFIIB
MKKKEISEKELAEKCKTEIEKMLQGPITYSQLLETLLSLTLECIERTSPETQLPRTLRELKQCIINLLMEKKILQIRSQIGEPITFK